MNLFIALLLINLNKMSDNEILLSYTTNHKEKYEAANNIIINYELSLNANQILLACKKILDWYNNNKKYFDWAYALKNRIFLFDTVLNINKNMYIAIILALCDNFCPQYLSRFIKFIGTTPVDIGLCLLTEIDTIESYKILLDHYDFDVSNISAIPSVCKQMIQNYRNEKYAGKSTKCAIKK